jgi:DNA modification methylase
MACAITKKMGKSAWKKTPEEYVANLVAVFAEVRRVLRDDGTLWLNLGDSYAGSGRGANSNGKQGTNKGTNFNPKNSGFVPDGLKPKDLIGIPWRVAFALQADGWYLRQEIIWHKNNPMPESVKDRCTKSHEHVFLLSKNARYFWNYEANMEEAAYDGRKDCQMKGSAKYQDVDIPGAKANSLHVGGHTRWTFKDGKAYRNRRSVWSIPTKPSREAHYAMMPPRLAELCILAGSRPGDVILDPFAGAGTTGMVARQLQRGFVGIELSKESCQIAHRRIYEEPKQAKAKTVRGKYKDALTPSDLFAQQKLW